MYASTGNEAKAPARRMHLQLSYVDVINQLGLQPSYTFQTPIVTTILLICLTTLHRDPFKTVAIATRKMT